MFNELKKTLITLKLIFGNRNNSCMFNEFVIPFDSLEGCDSNALILPDKKKDKKVYTLN